MALPGRYPESEVYLTEGTTSIASTPVVMNFVAPVSGYIVRGYANSFGTTTGTITVKVTVNSTSGGTDVFAGALTIASGAGLANNPGAALALPSSAITVVNEGDAILATPSGGAGATIGGAVTLVIRTTD